ncbi:MAG: hypothetical protein ABJB66_00705 [Gemmatimonadaceae bacterium]
MSDFLSRLGARQTSEPAIRPRAVSRFENADVSPVASQPKDAAVGASESSFGAESVNSTSREQPGKIGAVATRTPAPQVAPSFALNQSRDLLGLHDDVEQRLRSLLDSASRLSNDSPNATPAAETHSGQEPTAALSIAESNSMSPRDSSSATTTVITSIAPRVDATLHGGTNRDAARLDREAAPREPDVVHVHIGRVEVRAIHPTPERARARGQNNPDTTRPLSLERYLSAKDRK